VKLLLDNGGLEHRTAAKIRCILDYLILCSKLKKTAIKFSTTREKKDTGVYKISHKNSVAERNHHIFNANFLILYSELLKS